MLSFPLTMHDIQYVSNFHMSACFHWSSFEAVLTLYWCMFSHATCIAWELRVMFVSWLIRHKTLHCHRPLRVFHICFYQKRKKCRYFQNITDKEHFASLFNVHNRPESTNLFQVHSSTRPSTLHTWSAWPCQQANNSFVNLGTLIILTSPHAPHAS